MAIAASATVTTTVVTMSATSTATTRHVVNQLLNLLIGGLAVLQYLTFKVQCLASQGMVQVHLHLIFSDLHYTTVEVVSILILQGNDSIYVDVFVVKTAVPEQTED